MAKKKITFQQALDRLENVVEEMEQSETSLENLIKLYKEGIDLSVFCGESLQEAEKEVMMLQQLSEGVFQKSVFSTTRAENEAEGFLGDLDD